MTILIQVCEANDLPCAAMKTFSQERKQVLQDLQAQGMTRKEAKGIQNKCVFGGNLEKLQEQFSIPECVVSMHQEVKQITPRLLEIYPVFRQAAVEKHGSTYWNILGVALSLLFQTC